MPGEELKGTKMIFCGGKKCFLIFKNNSFVFVTRPKVTRGQKHMPNVYLSSLKCLKLRAVATRHCLNAFWMNCFIIGEHISESVQVERDVQLKVPLCLVFMDQKNITDHIS